MKIDWDVPIPMDGLVLRADVFRPAADGRYPAILSYGPYGKGLAFQEGYKTAWEIMARDYPDAVAGSTNRYAKWGGGDPGKWGADGYLCVRVGLRGAKDETVVHLNRHVPVDFHSGRPSGNHRPIRVLASSSRSARLRASARVR